MRIALLDDYQNVALSLAEWSRLKGRATVEVFREHIGEPNLLIERLRGFDVIMLVRERAKFPREVLAGLPKLKLIVTAGMWNASLDVEAATELGIQVCGTGGWPYATAELALGLMLALARQIPAEDQRMRRGEWQTKVGLGLHGQTLGILGLGKLGVQMARFGLALGMNVIAWSQNLTKEAAAGEGVQCVSKAELLAQADMLSIHLKLSERTRGIIAADDLRLMKPTAYLINTSRSPIVDEAALLDALQHRVIAGAALDVFDIEPLPSDHPLRKLDNVVLTPHIGYVVQQNHKVFYEDTLEDIEAFLDGRLVRPMNHPKAGRAIAAD
jgi:phosphoglycerate dehydrogenase-like enzyme